MSRIIVKQLPKTITEAKLRSVFGSKGTITDLQLKYTPDGKFRQFAFVGYRTPAEAEQAIAFFDNTCIQTNRVRVELCASLGNAPENPALRAKNASKDRTNKETEQKNAKEQKPKISKLDEIFGEHKNDPEFLEFLKLHDKKRNLWGNDAFGSDPLSAVDDEIEKNKNEEKSSEDEDDNEETDEDEEEKEDEEEANKEEKSTKLAEKPISDLEYMKSLMAGSSSSTSKNTINVKQEKSKKSELDLFTIKIQNVPYKTKRQDVLKFFKPLKPHSVRLPSKVHGFCYVGFKTEEAMLKAMATKNKSFILGKQVFFSDFTEKNKVTKAKKNIGENNNNNQSNDKDNGKTRGNNKWVHQEATVRENGEDIADSGRMFIRNLSYTTTEDDLQALFERYGPVTEVHLPVDTVTRQIKGFGTVTFMMPEHAVRAFNELDGTDFHGRLLHLMPAKTNDRSNDDNELQGNEAGLSFKEKKALKLKMSAQQPQGWNTLFLGTNAVAEILARNMGTSKAHLLDTEKGGSSAAVRMALGETQLVVEMKNFLEENGVCLEAFSVAPTALKRSKTIILAKNLPAETTMRELTPLFGKFGPLTRVILPPSGVTAIIEFSDPAEARRAFRNLAFSKFKDMPLFLEWAPADVFRTSAKGEPITISEMDVKPAILNEESNNNNNNEIPENVENDDDDLRNAEPEANTTLFLHNLNFKTELETVRDHFRHLGPIHTVEIARRRDGNDPKKFNSLGYGFIQFKLAETAAKALKQMQFTTIEDKQVELKRSDRVLRGAENKQTTRKTIAVGEQTGSKILVRNIPFQANAKEIRDIFKAFGEIRTLRLPMKMSPGESSHRGFGFVDFVTKNDAKQAFKALSHSTHLYGRRLVLEWAAVDDTCNVEELRKRTAQQYQQSSSGDSFGGAKRSRKAVFDFSDQVPCKESSGAFDEE